ncbi:MAG: DUF1579 domain-containing protein [Planctomycetota bacterium]|nr:DUF1579 domain-containing protein [Planctomycetota bacterium]
MKMKLMGLAAGLVVVSGLGLALAGEPAKTAKDAVKDAAKSAEKAAKDTAKQTEKALKDMAGQVEGDEAAMMAYMMPNEHHARLMALEGEWDVKAKWFPGPGAPAIENDMKATCKPILGGRYLMEKVTGTLTMGEGMPPMEFEGMSIMGYDNHKKQHTSVWIDNMMTGMWSEAGTCSADGKVITTVGENYNSMTGSMEKTKSVHTIVDANNWKLEMYSINADGTEVRTAEMVSTRKK